MGEPCLSGLPGHGLCRYVLFMGMNGVREVTRKPAEATINYFFSQRNPLERGGCI